MERADDIEAIVFKDNGEDATPAYRTKIRSLYSNLKDKNNPGLRGAVVSGELEPKKLCGMSSAVRILLVSSALLIDQLDCYRTWRQKNEKHMTDQF